MYEVRCPSCRLRLWLYQGMGREVPPPRDCPSCRIEHPVDRNELAAARTGVRIDTDHAKRRRAMKSRRPDGDPLWRPPAGPRVTR